jgi:hypothetical protein
MHLSSEKTYLNESLALYSGKYFAFSALYFYVEKAGRDSNIIRTNDTEKCNGQYSC